MGFIMRLPKTIKILDNVWTVEEKGRVVDENGEKLWGSCCYDGRKIEIKSTLSDYNKLLTYIHEFYHAALFEHGIELKSDIEEMIVECLSSETLKHFDIKLKKSDQI